MIDVFLSYRRTQSFMTERIHERICSVFKRDRVFLDRSEIKPGARFPEEIAKALDAAKIMLAIIDPDWISVQDERTKRRRLELRNDWVRIELERSLKADKIVIPVLIDGAVRPTREQLPGPLQGLAIRQYVQVGREKFAEDVDALIDHIKVSISERELQDLLDDKRHPWPERGEFRPVAVEGELLETMMKQLPHWKIVESPLTDDPRPGVPAMRREIVRHFRFPSFLDAIAFMESASKPIDEFGHHPRWENIFQTVRVALSTWDIGHQPSDRDFKTAIMLERHYEKFIVGR